MSELPPFRNEPALELRREPERAALESALAAIDARLPIRAPLWIGHDQRQGAQLVSTDPGSPDRIVALAPMSTAAEAAEAVRVAAAAARDWSSTPAGERAAALVRAADWLRQRRRELAALVLRECAKPWPEADGDVCEAIDALEYNARGALALAERAPLLQAPGERNELRYVARGVVAVISPWNFPLAIPAGMASAALATGNAVVLKPAQEAPGCAAIVVEALRAGGVPAAAIALVPGDGAAGAALVGDPRVHAIAFTGSVAVGTEILRSAAEIRRGQRQIKHVVAELGGKNCVIVDADADLDQAVPAIIRSGFAYAGQKCSAASRVLAHEAIYERLVERLGGVAATLSIGDAERFDTDVGAVISEQALTRIEEYTALAVEQQATIDGYGRALPEKGWFCAPLVVTGLPSSSRLLVEEIFGPILTVERVRDVDDACDRVDELPFALTGALFARNPRTVEQVIARSPVGNLYVNRHTTGAMVGRQPFGGNRLSGTGAKAGGPDYLLHFVESRVVTENTMRHGISI